MDTKPVFVPHTIEIYGEGVNVKEDILWNLRSKNPTPAEAAATLCAQLRLPATKDNTEVIQHQLERTLHTFRDVSTKAPLVTIKLQVPLSSDLVLIDKVVWNLGNPRIMVDRYATGLCRDLGLSLSHCAMVAKAFKQRIEACKQQLKAGGAAAASLQLVPPSRIGKRLVPSNYPALVRAPKRPKPEPAAPAAVKQEAGAPTPPQTAAAAAPGALGRLQLKQEGGSGGGSNTQQAPGAPSSLQPKQEGGSGDASNPQQQPAGGSGPGAVLGAVAKQEPADNGEDGDMPDLL